MLLKRDEMYRSVIQREIDEELSFLNERPSLHTAIMNRIEGEKTVKRKTSMTLVLAAMLVLLLGSMAAAAGLGLFGQLRASKVDEMSYARLGLLEDAAVTVGETRRIIVPTRDSDAQPETTREQVLRDQQGRIYELTIDQVYCDGRKLYYAYTMRMLGESVTLYDGEATGFGEWDMAYPGERVADVFDTYRGEAENRCVAEWLNGRERGYAVCHHASVGDGAELPDGEYLNPIDSGSEQVDANTMTAYYEVELPEDYAAGETIEFVLTILTSDTVYAQDENGVYSSSVMDRANLVDVSVIAPVTGSAKALTGEGTADEYPATAKVYVSDIDLSGSVRIEAPQEYIPEGYTLVADGETYANIDPWMTYEDGAHVLNLRFDLPPTMEHIVLMPLDPAYAHEAIELK